MARMVQAHFHGGPWSTQTRDVEAHQIRIEVREDGRHGTYTVDETSAGGRCYYWHNGRL